MFKTISKIIIFSSIAIINLANLADSKIVPPAWLQPKDIDSLRSLEPKQALPLLAIQINESKKLQYPTHIAQVEIQDGRLVHGTKFRKTLRSDEGQIFFCPDPDQNGHCLVPMHFRKSEILQCEYEPTALVQRYLKSYEKCGPKDIGIAYTFSYEFCPVEFPYSFTTSAMLPYSFCYDKSSKRNLFVSYRSFSAGLLMDQVLVREREIKFQELSTDMNGYIDEDYYKIIQKEAAAKPQYELQMLIRPEYIPLALWKKTTYHYINVALQHKTLINFWNEINGHITTATTESPYEPLYITTGLIYIPNDKIPAEKDDNQIYNIWYTAILDKTPEFHDKGIIILMNNFISNETNGRHYVDDLCPLNLCVDDLGRKFNKIGGQVRCCEITKVLKRFFYKGYDPIIGQDKNIKEVLHIRNITV